MLARALMCFIAKVEIGSFRPPAEPKRGFIIVANHRSMIDLMVGLLVFQRWNISPYIFVREDFFTIPVVGFLLRSIGGIPAGPQSGVPALRRGLAILKNGGTLVIMPEGKITLQTRQKQALGKLMPGAARLASSQGNPVLVAGILNSDLAWPLGALAPRLHFRRSKRPNIVTSVEWLEITRGAPNSEVLAAIERQMRSVLRDLEVAQCRQLNSRAASKDLV